MHESIQVLPGGVLAIVPPACAGCGAQAFTLHWQYPAIPGVPVVWTNCEYCGREERMTGYDLKQLMTPPVIEWRRSAE